MVVVSCVRDGDVATHCKRDQHRLLLSLLVSSELKKLAEHERVSDVCAESAFADRV